jgi:GxxExxY protein
VHNSLGPGLLETVYRRALAFELSKRGLVAVEERGIPVIYDDVALEIGFRADIIVNNKVIVETKSIEALAPIHGKILLTYLRLTDLKLGLLINFNVELIKDGSGVWSITYRSFTQSSPRTRRKSKEEVFIQKRNLRPEANDLYIA